MKRVMSLVLTVLMCVTISACQNEEDKGKLAFDVSKTAYDNVTVAYEITEQLSSDLYEAWRLGIHEDAKILSGGVSFLADELSLSEDELKDGVGYVMAKSMDQDWFELSEEEKQSLVENADLWFSYMKDDLFSFCVLVVTGAYKANGKVEEAQDALDTAKEQMKELSENYSDYEHYPNLKGYYTATSSFFDFCQDPSGSFEQVKDTVNDYKNEARDYISDLDYIFEE